MLVERHFADAARLPPGWSAPFTRQTIFSMSAPRFRPTKRRGGEGGGTPDAMPSAPPPHYLPVSGQERRSNDAGFAQFGGVGCALRPAHQVGAAARKPPSRRCGSGTDPLPDDPVLHICALWPT